MVWVALAIVAQLDGPDTPFGVREVIVGKMVLECAEVVCDH